MSLTGASKISKTVTYSVGELSICQADIEATRPEAELTVKQRKVSVSRDRCCLGASEEEGCETISTALRNVLYYHPRSLPSPGPRLAKH